MAEALQSHLLADLRWRHTHSMNNIKKCLDQLDEAQLWWRPDHGNAIGNLILHICGSATQWMGAASGAAYDPERWREFDATRRYTKDELIALLDKTNAIAQHTFDAVADRDLLQRIRVQGFDMTLVEVLLADVHHTGEHTAQIAYITKMLKGDAYQRLWVPENEEQAAGATAGLEPLD